jgi:hypothetical protein
MDVAAPHLAGRAARFYRDRRLRWSCERTHGGPAVD